MTNEAIPLSRRRFLTGAAALMSVPLLCGLWPKSALAQAISQALPQFVALRQAQQGILTGAHWGAFEALVQDGRMVDVKPIQDDPAPNELITMAPHQVHAPNRVKYPMVRKSWLEGGPLNCKPELRGRDEWVRVSWDKALTLVSEQITRLQKEHGPQAIYAGSYGWKSVGMLHNSRTLLHRLLNLTGGFGDYSGDYSTGAAQVIMAHVVGSMEVYEQQTAWPNVIENSKLVVLWGCNPLITLKNSWNMPDHEGLAGFEALKKKGTRIISIDPIYNESARDLKAHWIAPRPYTDSAMIIGIAHTLLAEKLHDADFLKTYTVGFDKFEAYLTGKEDGVVKDADWAAAICGIDANTLRELAREMAKQRTMIMAGWGIQRQHRGEQPHWLLVTLAAMLGQIGLPGGGFGFSYHYSSGGSPTARGGILAGISAGKAPKNAPASIPVARIADCLANPGKTINFNGARVTYPDVKMVYVAGGNTFHQHQDTNNLVKAWQRPQTIVVNEPYWTATAKHADIVLPATTSYERNDMEMGGDYSQLYVFPMHQCVPPQHESRNDFDIFAGLAEKLGVLEAYSNGKNEMQWLKGMYDDMKAQARDARVALPPFDMFWASNNYIRFPVPEQNKQWVRFADFRENPLLNPLGTPSGKIEIYSDTVEKMGYDDCRGIPGWMPPHEWYQGPQAQKYPLSLNTAHPVNRLHSQLDNTPLRKKYAVADREAIWINPDDASLRGIADGDLVRAFNDRGQILVGAKVTPDVRPGVVRISEGAWFDPANPAEPGSLCKNGNVNCLTFDIGSSSLAQGNCGHMAQLEIEKYQGPALENTAHAVPVGA
ncbi:trimethylamine-N-oxide reductase TorA [Enterobacterales bacterium BIT-L3]|uniref:trimethylamine-N-oxide reductase n=3 Tax=Enterobacteriaceae TaxID=543 RepID=A0A8K0XVA8_9ENTR|nr:MULTISPECIES: trimethylamine-N-oxide reductase TorA [Tenebrionibacter/Tenebrionicola group]MBK4713775.1 trimethylamine-N-oxide reductase TorA [Tenebrionibacter intestinalis]MBV5094656.1 trimethylamine-N-oxide reductase TorA [Tenebrionicola larvae]